MTPLEFDEALVMGAQGVLALAAAWGGLLLGAAVVESATRGRVRALARVGCPVAWRPVLLSTLAVAMSLAGGVAGPAQAAPRDVGPRGPAPGTALLPVPTRPVGDVARSPRAHERPGRPERPPAVLVVGPGDSLWTLARGRLGGDAPAARVLALTVALHRANRAVVGADPDLVHPGQRLRVPPTPSPREDPLP